MLGLGSGIFIAVVARIVETSRLAFGPYAFYGNGALIVPALGAALAIYALWTWIIRSRRPRRELLFATLGLHLGVGTAALMSGPSLGSAPPSFLFIGLIFVLPTAIAAYGVFATFERRLGTTDPAAMRTTALLLTLVVAVGLVLAVPLAMIGTGLIAGAFVAIATRASERGAIGLGAILVVVLLAAGLAVPLLLSR